MRMQLPTAVALSLGLSLGLPFLCVGQDVPVRPREGEFVCYPNHVGGYKFGAEASGSGTAGLTPAQVRVFRSKIDSVAAALKVVQVFNPPTGIEANVYLDYCCTPQCKRSGTCGRRPAYGRLWYLLKYFYDNYDPKAAAGKPFTFVEHRSEVEIYFNDSERMWDGAMGQLLDGRDIHYQPEPWGKVGGLTLYNNQSRTGDLWLFFTSSRTSQPLWLPVSNEQYLQSLIVPREAKLASDLKELPPQFHANLRKAYVILLDQPKAQLAAMSPAERAAQAWVAVAEQPPVPPGTQHARPLVVFNKDFFDMSRPRTDIQFMVVRLEGIPREGGKPRMDNLRYCSEVSDARLWEFVEQVNWPKVVRWMD